ncbi:lysine--tRNA ligase [Basilea psittacipulmonis]|uniref:Lysine--tRNA ligase n=1 Tax=Basilea psittacipulmonis DSM 24701 TaxID=1072685 RepID=A0A077DC36_9BURK|nr:lysine--tRNA ligase [Basilea psittacipulmonis]AIL32435.1 lysyl-tRNA synthetase [Basilea psittacipulmonis DSM 24701]
MSEQQLDENKLMAERRAKLTEIRQKGVAFPNDARPTDKAGLLHEKFDDSAKEELESQNHQAYIAGRMMLKRVMGKASFATLQDATGRIQIYLDKDSVGEERYAEFKQWDLGDIIEAKGTVFKTNRGELSIHAHEIRLLTKSLRPLPDKFHGLADQEIRYRQRYVDLIMTPETRETFLKRSKALNAVRQYMMKAGFLEVETPMLHPIPGGASAKPFITHHNALDMDMYLRIAPELYLKRLIVGGFERVFEINRNFRNEGVSVRHNPEFTMMEFYAAYWNYQDMMDFTEQLLRDVAIETTGSAVLTYQGQTVDLSQPFDRLTVTQAILKYCPQYTSEQLADENFLRQEIKRLGAEVPVTPGIGALHFALFEETTEHLLWNPTFIVDYPVEVSPLARASDKDPSITERFELFMTGREYANAFSELNDPEDQAERFRKQAEAKDAGDEEAMYYDADFIRALEYGMPPTAGCGIGIDRFMMLLTDSPNIRDVLLFPHLRREE